MNNRKDLTYIQRLSYIKEFNPYYLEEEGTRYFDKVDSDIFDLLDLNNIDDNSIRDFRKMKFEYIFIAKINDFISKFISKIKNIQNFQPIVKLINLKRIKIIKEKIINKFLNLMKEKFEHIRNKEKESGEELYKEIEVFGDLTIIYFFYERKENRLDFIRDEIQNLSKI